MRNRSASSLNTLKSDEAAIRSLENDGSLEVENSVNFRDVGTVSSKLKLGRVYRSSQVVSTSELASLKIQTVLDLRQAPVLCKAQRRNFWQALKRGWMAMVTSCCPGSGQNGVDASVSSGSSYGSLANPALVHRDSSLSAAAADHSLLPVREYTRHMKHAAPCWRCTAECDQQYGVEATVFHVDMLPRGVSLHILFALPRKLQARVLVCAVQGGKPEPIVAGAVADPCVMGYLRLYQILLDKSKPNLARALRLFCDPANFPVLVHCIHGKDRTGLVVMLLLLLCGIDTEVIIQDYAMSEVLLRESRDKNHLSGLQEYLTTDQVMAASRHVMQSTIEHLKASYSTAQRYALEIGLSAREIAAIRRNLLKDDKAGA